MTTVRERGSTVAPWPRVRVSRRQVTAFVVVFVLYAAYTLLILKPSDVGYFDRWIYTIHFRRDLLPTPVYDFLLGFVYFGQRGVATLVFLPYFVWVALRVRSGRPVIMLALGLILLNLTVGVVKLGVGRLGPRVTTNVFDLHLGGDIYPSGHVSNVVILYGLMAWISLRHRTLLIFVTFWLSVTVGVSAVMLNTHWFSDMVGGWFAGGLVLLAIPFFLPPAERLVNRIYYRNVKHHTDPWVAKLQSRWPGLSHIGPAPVAGMTDEGSTERSIRRPG